MKRGGEDSNSMRGERIDEVEKWKVVEGQMVAKSGGRGANVVFFCFQFVVGVQIGGIE